MQALKTFARTFIKSLTSLTYYADVARAPFGFSFKYFTFFSLILTVIITGIFSYFISREVPPFIERLVYYGEHFYPDDLLITVKDDKLSINRPEPFVVPVPFELLTDQPAAIPDSVRVNLFTFDSSATVTNFDQFDSLVVANSELVMTRSEGNTGEIRVFPVRDSEDFVIDKNMVTMGVQTLTPLTGYIVPFLIIIAALITLIVVFTSKLVTLVFLSLFTFLLGKYLVGLSLPYKKYLQIGLHSMTLVTLVQLVFFFTNQPTPFGAFYSVFFILFTLVILAHIKPLLKAK